MLFGEFAKPVGNGTRDAQRHRAVSNSIPSEAIADLIDGTVGRPSCHAYFGAGAAAFILKSKRKFKFQIPVLFEMRHRDRQERDGLLVWVLCEDRAHEIFWAKLSAASTLAIAPIIILGWFTQRQLVRGLTLRGDFPNRAVESRL